MKRYLPVSWSGKDKAFRVYDFSYFYKPGAMSMGIYDYPVSKIKYAFECCPYADGRYSEDSRDKAIDWLFAALQYDNADAERLALMVSIENICDKTDNTGFETVQDCLRSVYQTLMDDLNAFKEIIDFLGTATIDDSNQDAISAKADFDRIITSDVLFPMVCPRLVSKGRSVTYGISTLFALLVLDYWGMSKKNKAFKICQNCGKAFVPADNKAIRCERISPFDSRKTCKEDGKERKREKEYELIPDGKALRSKISYYTEMSKSGNMNLKKCAEIQVKKYKQQLDSLKKQYVTNE